jgi:hypothetical protein
MLLEIYEPPPMPAPASNCLPVWSVCCTRCAMIQWPTHQKRVVNPTDFDPLQSYEYTAKQWVSRRPHGCRISRILSVLILEEILLINKLPTQYWQFSRCNSQYSSNARIDRLQNESRVRRNLARVSDNLSPMLFVPWQLNVKTLARFYRPCSVVTGVEKEWRGTKKI